MVIEEEALRKQPARGQDEPDIPQVAIDRRGNIGELDLHRDTRGSTGGRERCRECGCVDLPDGGGGEGHAVERRECAGPVKSERFGEDLLGWRLRQGVGVGVRVPLTSICQSGM